MCQFNLVLVKNIKNKKILKDNQYNSFGNNINNFFPYVKGFCNCNSFVGSMCEYNGNNYFEMLESLNKSELQRLNQIKNFMNTPNYMELRQNYIQTRDLLSNVIEELFEPVSNYEIEQLNLFEKKYKGKELQKHTELLYKELEDKIKKIENSPKFKSAEAKLNVFKEKNELMEESTLYYLTKEDEDKECTLIPDDEFIPQDEFIEDSDIFSECISIPEEDSLVIDNVIRKLENTYNNNYSDFLKYKQLFEKLLENEEYILFACIWDTPQEMSIEKQVNINDLVIEDLASLEFNKMLKIYR